MRTSIYHILHISKYDSLWKLNPVISDTNLALKLGISLTTLKQKCSLLEIRSNDLCFFPNICYFTKS